MSQQEQNGVCWSVSALVHAISDALKARFATVVVRGEISSFTRAASGHCYFTLKDEQAQIRCAMFQRAAALLSFQPANGNEVELRGRLTLYEPRGELQLVVESMQPVGQGLLLEKFQQLKNKLAQEGLFESDLKKTLPAFPQKIGIVSSLQAAALHDVLTTLQRRAPHLSVVIYPTRVQGAQSVTEIVQAIQTAEQRQEVETLIICRGGGSLEDLWSFNEEAVVRAIAACSIPTISAVGHETDFTLSDFVADLRAPTPTAAAEIVSPSRASTLDTLEKLQQRLQRESDYHLNQLAQRVDRASLALQHPEASIQTWQQQLQQQSLRLKAAASTSLSQKKERLHTLTTQYSQLQQQPLTEAAQALSHLTFRYHQAAQQAYHVAEQRLTQNEARLQALNPAKVLATGYAWITTEKGKVISSAQQLKPNQTIQARFADGKATATVIQSERDLLDIFE